MALGAGIIAKGLAATNVVKGVAGMYGATGSMDAFFDKHFEKMKTSENITIARSGRVLEGAKSGFGLGYVTPVVVVAVGQYLLGNTVAALGTVGTAAVFANPMAMSCASIGAIYYGWSALTDQERQETLEAVSSGLGVGVELVKAIVNFVIEKSEEVMDSKNTQELKHYVSDVAALFGKTLYDVTGQVVDMVSSAVEAVAEKSSAAIKKTKRAISDSGQAIIDTAGKAKDGLQEVVTKSRRKEASDD